MPGRRRRTGSAALLPVALVLLGFSAPHDGVLRIESQPGVEVVWEGVSLGATDERGELEIADIPPGRYSIVLRKLGHTERQVSVKVPAGATTLALRLDPVPTAPRPAPQPTPPAQAAGGAGKPAAVEAAPEPEGAPVGPTPPTPATEGPPAADASADAPEASAPVADGAGAAAPEAGAAAGLGFGLAALLLVTGAAVWAKLVQRRRRGAPAAAGVERTDPHRRSLLRLGPERQGGAAKAAFLEDLKRREVVLERFLAADGEQLNERVVDLRSAEADSVEEEP